MAMTNELVVVTEREFMRKILEGERDFSGVRLEDINLNRNPGFIVKYASPNTHIGKNGNPLILNGAEIHGLTARGVYLTVQAEGAEFLQSDLDYSHFGGIFRGTGFYQSTLNGTSFFMTSMEDTDFQVTSLFRTAFKVARMRRARFGDCSLQNAYFRVCDLREVDFNSSTISQTLFDEVNLQRAFFNEIMDEATSFLECDLRGTTFADGSSFEKANFARCKVYPHQKEKYDQKLPLRERFVVTEEEPEEVK